MQIHLQSKYKDSLANARRLGNRSTTTIGSPKNPPKTTTLKQKKQQIAAAVSTIELK